MLLRVVLIAAGALATAACLAQTIDPKAIREEDLPAYTARKIAVFDYVPSPSKRARELVEQHQLVALGELAAVADPEGVNPLAPRTVIATFHIDELYKGPAGTSEISVELMSDMLVAPDENISRYAKRNRDGPISTRIVAAIHGTTFYDLGGLLKPGEKYLLAANATANRSDVYALNDAAPFIFWSDTRDEIVSALRAMPR